MTEITKNNFIGQKVIAYTLGFFVISFLALFFFSNKVKASEVPLFEKAIIDSNGFIEINDSNKTKSLIGLGFSFSSPTTVGSLTADNLLNGWVSNNGFNIIKDLSNLDNGSYSVYPTWYIGEYTEYFWLNGKVGDFVNREVIDPHYHKSFSYNTTNVGNLVLFYASTSTGGGDRNYRGLSYWDLYDYQTPLNYTDYPNWTNQEFLAGQITTSDSVENLAFTHPDYISLGANFIEFEFTPNVPPTVFNIDFGNVSFENLNENNDFVFNFSYDYCNHSLFKYKDIRSAYFGFSPEIVKGIPYESSSDLIYLKDPDLIGPQSCKGNKLFTLKKEDIRYLNTSVSPQFYVNFEWWNPLFGVWEYRHEQYQRSFSITEVLGNYLESGIVNTISYNIQKQDSAFLPFNYNFENFEDLANSSVCLYHKNGNQKTSFCYDFNASSTESGVGFIEIPGPDTPDSYELYFKSSLSSKLYSKTFKVNWYDVNYIDPTTLWISTKTNREMACTEDEWSTPDPTFDVLGYSIAMPAFNFSKIGCNIKLGFLNTTSTINDYFFKTIDVAKAGFTNIFPFTIPIKIYDSWVASETAVLPAELNFLKIGNENNEVIVSFPKQLLGTDTNLDFPLLSSSAMSLGDSRITNVFLSIRTFTKYLQWLAFIVLIFVLGSTILKNLGANKITENAINK